MRVKRTECYKVPCQMTPAINHIKLIRQLLMGRFTITKITLLGCTLVLTPALAGIDDSVANVGSIDNITTPMPHYSAVNLNGIGKQSISPLYPSLSGGINYNQTAHARTDYTSSYSSLNYSRMDYASLPDLPDLGNGSNRFVEEREHKALGEWSLRHINAGAPLLTDPWVQEELETLTWKINAQVRNQAPLALVIINDANINAFAIPGGVIGINTGTVLSAGSIDEVASVLAHEVAHLSQHHYEHRNDDNTKDLWVQIATIIASVAAASVDTDAATAIMLGGQTAVQNGRMAFSRNNEREADRIGMQIMAQAGFDPKAMPLFFATLSQRSELNRNGNSFLPSFIMTHPLSSERMSEAQTRANSYPTRNFVDGDALSQAGTLGNDERFELLKWRIAVITGEVQETALLTAAEQNYGAKLALATFYADKARYSEAVATLSVFDNLPALQRQSYEPLLSITKAYVAGKQGQWQQAVDLLQTQQTLYPERRDTRLYLADALLRLSDDDTINNTAYIQQLLLPLIEQTPYDVEALRRVQLSYERMASAYRLIASRPSANPLNSSVTVTPSNASALATLANANALRYRGQRQMWQTDYEEADVSFDQALIAATSLEGSPIRPQSLIAKINLDKATLEEIEAFKP